MNDSFFRIMRIFGLCEVWRRAIILGRSNGTGQIRNDVTSFSLYKKNSALIQCDSVDLVFLQEKWKNNVALLLKDNLRCFIKNPVERILGINFRFLFSNRLKEKSLNCFLLFFLFAVHLMIGLNSQRYFSILSIKELSLSFEALIKKFLSTFSKT